MAILEREVKLRGGPEVLDRLAGQPLEPRRAREASTACVLGQLVERQRRRRERSAWS